MQFSLWHLPNPAFFIQDKVSYCNYYRVLFLWHLARYFGSKTAIIIQFCLGCRIRGDYSAVYWLLFSVYPFSIFFHLFILSDYWLFLYLPYHQFVCALWVLHGAQVCLGKIPVQNCSLMAIIWHFKYVTKPCQITRGKNTGIMHDMKNTEQKKTKTSKNISCELLGGFIPPHRIPIELTSENWNSIPILFVKCLYIHFGCFNFSHKCICP